MEKGKKNIDELFAEARKSKVSVPVDKVAKTILTGAAVAGASTAATAAAVTGKSILTLSTPTIMTGTIITAAAVTATTIAVVNSGDEDESNVPAVDSKKSEYVEPTEENQPLDEETIEFTPIVEQPIDVEDVIDDEELVMIEEDMGDPIGADEGDKKSNRLVLSSDDSEEEFEKKIKQLKERGYKVDVGKVVLNKDKSKLSMNFVNSGDANTVCANLDIDGPFKLVFEWDKNDRLSFTHDGKGSVNVVNTTSTKNKNGKKTTNVSTTTTSNSSRSSSSSSSSTQINTDDDGNTIIINTVDGESDTVSININGLNLDIDEMMKKINKQVEIQMGNLEIQLENMHEHFEEIEIFDCEEIKKKEEKEKKEKVKEKEMKEKVKEKEKLEEKDDLEFEVPGDELEEIAPLERVEIPVAPRAVKEWENTEELEKVEQIKRV